LAGVGVECFGADGALVGGAAVPLSQEIRRR
jgi:hypothetical protein